MFAVIRHYHFDPKDSAEIDRRIREEFVPIVKKAKGFVRYYWLDTGKGEGARLSASLRTKPVPMNRCTWLPITYKRICLNFASRNPRLSKARSKLTIERPQSQLSRLHVALCRNCGRARERSCCRRTSRRRKAFRSTGVDEKSECVYRA
jgi:hypothetical protein